jgi:hypothetical protein
LTRYDNDEGSTVTITGTGLKAVAAAAAVVVVGAAAPGQCATPTPDFSGFWEHSSASHLPREPAPWTPLARQLLKQDQDTHWHNGVSEENTFCLPAGMPFMMSGSEGFDISQNPREMVIVNEERPSPRHIYLAGQPRPKMEDFDRTSVGYSVGRWVGDELVVDTVGFLPGATVGFVRTDTTHLVERYHLEDGGRRLRITYTWDDPKLFTKPWTYAYLVERAPPERYALEYYCDPRDGARARP